MIRRATCWRASSTAFAFPCLFGLCLTLLSSVIGILAGAVQGYFGGWTDLLFQRFIEIWTSMPTLFLLIILASVVTPSFAWLLLTPPLCSAGPALVGVVRAEFLKARNLDFVRAARALGVGPFTIMIRHLLPNAMVAALTAMPFVLVGGITALTSLDFLGFGLPAGSPSLGELLNQGKNNLQAPWLGITGFLVMAVMLSLLVFHRRGRAGCLRSAKDVFVTCLETETSVPMSLLNVKDLSVRPSRSRAASLTRLRVSLSASTKGRPWRWWGRAAPANP